MATTHKGFPPALASMAVSAGPAGPRAPTGERGHLVGSQRLEALGLRAVGCHVIEQPDHVGRQGRPGGHHDEQRRERQLPCQRQIASRLALSAQWRSSATSRTGALGAGRLHQVHDLLDDPVLDVAGRPPRHPGASWPASSAPIAALRGSGDRRLSSSAAAITPNGRVRSKG